MQIQQKNRLTAAKYDRLPANIVKLGGAQVRSTFVRDKIFIPDNRAYNMQFIDRFALTDLAKGLFFRLREENDLAAGTGSQVISLQAYRVDADFIISDQIDTYLDSRQHSLSDVIRLLELIGIDQVLEITKKRLEYTLLVDVFRLMLNLDQVEGIDTPFLEICATVDKTESEAIKSTINSIRDQLKLALKDTIVTPYHQMILRA